MLSRLPRSVRAVVLAAMSVLAGAANSTAQDPGDPSRLQPGSEGAKPATAYAWTSAVKGLIYDDEGKVKPSDAALRYTWVLPAAYDADMSYDLVVICHGTGLDYRWGHWNFKPGQFRPRDIVVSVDGPTEAKEGTRLFLGMRGDVVVFRDFLLEMGRQFHARRIYLYGHSQGSFFVAHFAGEFPRLIDGVVAQSSGAWDWSKDTGAVQKVPIVFLHGTSDPVVPYDQSTGARNAYAQAGHPMAHLRRMPRFNHWPNAVRASECIDWCIAMRTESPDEALAAAESLLTPKPPDEYEYVCPPDFGGARMILRRIEDAPTNDADGGGGGEADATRAIEVGAAPTSMPPLKGVDDAMRAKAHALAQRIESEGQRHVGTLKARIKSRADLTIDGPVGGVTDPKTCSWIGHLASLREDFRSVDCVEAYAKELDLDALLAQHAKAIMPIEEAWLGGPEGGGGPDPKATFAAAVENLPKCFLHEGLPPTLGAKLAEWRSNAESLGIPAETAANAAVIDAWRTGWDQGLRQYADLCRSWR